MDDREEVKYNVFSPGNIYWDRQSKKGMQDGDRSKNDNGD